MTATFSSEFVTRAPTHADIPAIFELATAYDIATIGHPYLEVRTIDDDWTWPGFDLSKDALLVLDDRGQIVGYECLLGLYPNGRSDTDGYVHPDFAGRGIGTYLLRWADARARERFSELPILPHSYLQSTTFGNDPLSKRLFEAEGYFAVRHHWRMEIDLVEAPDPVEWPTGITVRAYVPGQDEHAIWEAMNEIFTEEWNYVVQPFEEWLAAKITGDEADPSLFLLATEGEQIIGISRGMYRQDEGWIRTFGVRPAWRKRGIALALLHHSFGEFYRRGKTNVGLGVDSQNPTGATLFYERGGMHATLTFDTYQKDLLFASEPDGNS